MGDNRRDTFPNLQIIVQFVEGDDPRAITFDANGRLQAKGIDFQPFYDELADVPEFRIRRTYPLDPDRLMVLRDRARKNSGRNDLPWLNYFIRVSVPPDTDTGPLLRRLGKLDIVARASVAGRSRPPCPVPIYPQPYFGPAEDGVDADFAWHFDGDGTDIAVCVCDWSFDPEHQDLPPIEVIPLGYVPPPDPELVARHAGHGTAALGTLLAIDNDFGTRGLCPKAKGYFAPIVPESGNEPTAFDVSLRIDAAIDVLGPGDVLLVESEEGNTTPAILEDEEEETAYVYHPADFNLDVRMAILTAVELGITVVLPAGNGALDRYGQDLAALRSSEQLAIWDPGSDDFADCGAIMVGAGEPPDEDTGTSSIIPARTRAAYSNFGSRVDCQGWSRWIITPGWDEDYVGPTDLEYLGFSHTSGASAMIAGVAACIQSAAKACPTGPLEPRDVRQLLANSCLGSPQPAEDAAEGPIGPLPDLRRIFRAAGITPDIFLRDSLEDDGTLPYGGVRKCRSPDIIIGDAAAAEDPAVDADLAADWYAAYAGVSPDPNQARQVILRARNRGARRGEAGIALYTAPAAPYNHPSAWRLLDRQGTPRLAPDETCVLGPVEWPAHPGGRHRGLVAVVERPREVPLSPDSEDITTGKYARLLHCGHEICIRNAFEFETRRGQFTDWFDFEFRGDPDEAMEFRITLSMSFPEGTQFKAEPELPPIRIGFPRPSGFGDPGVGPYGPRDVDFRLRLEPGEARRQRIRVRPPARTPPGLHAAYLDQWYDGRHLGRLTYLLRVIDG